MPRRADTDAASRPASLADVARLAGVSAQTVSRVAAASPLVSEATRERVLTAMRDLDYAPNTAARALRSGRFDTVGVIARHLNHVGESRTLEAVASAARRAGQIVALVDLDSDDAGDLVSATTSLRHHSIDSLIIIRAGLEEPARLQLPSGVPAVASDEAFTGICATVRADDHAGASAASHHVLELGHERVQLLSGPCGSASARAREDAWRVALGRAVCGEVLRGDWSAESGYALASHVDQGATAVLCANDEMAAGLISGLGTRGLSVPGDVSVTGFDDVPLAPYIGGGLTTVRQDFEGIGGALVDAALRGASSDTVVLVETPLVVRATTSRPW